MSILTAFASPLLLMRKHFGVLMQHFKKMSIYWRTPFIPNACSTAFLIATNFSVEMAVVLSFEAGKTNALHGYLNQE